MTFERMSAGQASAIASSLKRAQPQPVGKTASVFGGGVAHSTDSSSQRGGPVQGVVLHGVSNARNVQSASNSGGSSRAGNGSRSGVAAFQNTPLVSEATRATASSGSPPATAGRCKRRVNCEDDGSSSADPNERHDGSEGGSSNSGGDGGGRKPVVPIVPKCADVVVHGGVKMPPMPPVEFLRRILVLHRYDVGPISSLNTSGAYYHRKPTPEQVKRQHPCARLVCTCLFLSHALWGALLSHHGAYMLRSFVRIVFYRLRPTTWRLCARCGPRSSSG